MNRNIIAFFIIFTLCANGSFAEPRGWGMGLGTFDGDFGLQARKDFMFGQELQYAIDLQAGVYNQNNWTTRLDADFHYIFRPDSTLRFYPLAGIGLALQKKSNRLGANIGGGVTFDINKETRFFLEAKYVAGDWEGFAFTGGIYF